MTSLSSRFRSTTVVGAVVLATLALGVTSASSTPLAGATKSFAHAGSPKKAPSPLGYNGGKLLTNSKTYAIFWGTPSAFPSDLVSGMTALLSGFANSTYLATANQYMGTTATTQFMGAYSDTTAPPKTGPNVSTIVNEVASVLATHGLTAEPSAVYLVYTSNLPKVNYCAWHAAGTIGTTTVQVGYLPNTSLTTGCFPSSGWFSSTTSYSYGTRSIADNTAHEFMEAITDPVPPTGWVDANGAEIGDKCNFVYLGPVTLSGANNVWQIQSEWSNATGACAQTTP
jgi:hypothetical protein